MAGPEGIRSNQTSFALLPFKRGASVQKLTNERYGAVVPGSDIGA